MSEGELPSFYSIRHYLWTVQISHINIYNKPYKNRNSIISSSLKRHIYIVYLWQSCVVLKSVSCKLWRLALRATRSKRLINIQIIACKRKSNQMPYQYLDMQNSTKILHKVAKYHKPFYCDWQVGRTHFQSTGITHWFHESFIVFHTHVLSSLYRNKYCIRRMPSSVVHGDKRDCGLFRLVICSNILEAHGILG